MQNYDHNQWKMRKIFMRWVYQRHSAESKIRYTS